MNKTLKEYLTASWKFLAAIFIIMVIVVAFRLSSDFPSSIQSLLTLGGVVLIGLAGWSAVRNNGFNLRQAIFVGFLLSFGTHWSLPIFHRAGEVLYLIFINTIVYSLFAALGGFLAKLSAQRNIGS